MHKLIKYQLYLLQLENYELPRYYKLLIARGFWPAKNQRGQLKWTLKSVLILLFAFVFHLLLATQLAWMILNSYDSLPAMAAFAAFIFFGCLFYFIFYSIALIIIWPLQAIAKAWLLARARMKIKKMPQLKVIAVAGSYGKTTMKAALSTVLEEKYAVASTADSINTPLGIAKFILKTVEVKTEILVIEMGEHYRGDIKELCDFIRPDIGVITGINESHLERMGDLKTVVATIFELADGLKPEGLLVMNIDDKNIVENFAKFTERTKIKFYSGLNDQRSQFRIENFSFNEADLTNSFDIESGGEKVHVISHILGEYIRQLASAAAVVGAELAVDLKSVAIGLNKLWPVNHRLQPIINPRGLLVIDDGYNGNPDGVREAINLISKFKDRRKVYVTPGLVETGDSAKAIHMEIGRQLAGAADLVILIRNSVTPFIAEGLEAAGFDKAKIIWFETAPEAHHQIGKILTPNDVVLFQNDWGDQYI